VIVHVLAAAWGAGAGACVLALSGRAVVVDRARGVLGQRPAREPRVRRWPRLRLHPAVARWIAVLRALRRRRQHRRREDSLRAELPIAIDLLLVATSSGATPYQSVLLAARWAPPLIGARLDEIGRTCALGTSFDGALTRAAQQEPVLSMLVHALQTAAELGAPVADALARCAHEVRNDVRRRAEAHARTVPVRLLFPLVLCLLPAFALLTVVPVLLDGIAL